LLAGLVKAWLSPAVLNALRLPLRDGSWFAPVQLAACIVITLTGARVSVVYPTLLEERLAGALAVSLIVPAVGLLGPTLWRPTLLFAAAALVEVALAIPDPLGLSPWLHRTALVTVALTIANVLCAEVLPRAVRSESSRAEETRLTGAFFGVLAGFVLLFLIGREFALFDTAANRTPMEPYAIIPILFCIAWLILSAIRCAVVPGRDRLGLTESWRTIYVYGAEILLLLAFIHLRLTVPELFSGWIGRYWTLVVMLLGFLGMGLSEVFDRQDRRVLAEPLRRTGLALPAIPLIAYWIHLPLAPAEAFPSDLGQYGLLWILLAVLLGLTASVRRSTLFAFSSALALNFGLWSFLAHGGIVFASHPQLWLIPLALIVLVAEHLNRDRLPSDAAAALRYLGVITIYVSSTADLFIAGLGHSVVLPVVLAVLSVAGVLAGISLQVRAFLFLGFSFLLLDILTMIWHAAVDRYHTWVWWVSGIVLGAAILALFAVFEKRRTDVLRLIDQIKRWN
jgi:hypothetical protein